MASTINNGKTCLEVKGREMRNALLQKNKWYTDYQYNKPMIDDEYYAQQSLYNGRSTFEGYAVATIQKISS